MFKTWLKSFGFVLLVMISLLLLYTAYDKQTKTLQFEKVITVLSFSDTKLSLNELNKITALGAIGIIAIVFMLGPLSKFSKNICALFNL